VPGERIEDLPVESLRFGLSPRVEATDPKHVAALAEVLRDVPPILVHASTMRVIDGVHRVLAARSVGQTTIRAVMFEGDETAAHIEAVRTNVRHGKPLTLAEREAAASKFLELVPEWSDRRIATVSGLSPKTVARLRERATVDSAQLRTRVGRDGRVRAVDSTEVRRRVVEALRSDPAASNRAIARRTRASQATVRDVRERLARGENGLLSVVQPGRPKKRSAATGEPGAAGAPTVVPDEFAGWFAARGIDDADWQPHVDAIPISRVYEVADVCRRRSESWRAFAMALEDRARTHKRDTSAG
jgi:ParB-like chromosome segregation protein Spo0J